MIKNFNKKKLILGFGYVLILLFIIATVFLSLIQRQLRIDVRKESLRIMADDKAREVNIFLEFQKEKLTIITSMNVFKEAVLYPNDPVKIKIAKNMINELKDIIPGISILTNEGIAVIGEFDLPGTDYSQHPYFARKDIKISFERYYDPQRKADYYSVIGPIYDNTNKSKIIGRMALDIDLDKISTLMKESTESKTIEVYLIDETGLLLSKSAFIGKSDKSGVLIQEVRSNGANECLVDLKKYQKDGAIEEHKEVISQYKNYMGDEVFGTIAYVPDIMGCVIAEESSGAVLGVSTGDYIINIFSGKEVKNEN